MATTYMQRRKGSGIYEFRKRLPLSLAGKPAPEHVRQDFPDLVNATTGHFKRELVKSLGTSDHVAARKADHRLAHETLERFEAAERLMREDPAKASSPPASARSFTSGDLEAIAAEARAGVLRQDDEAREQDYRATEQGLADRQGLSLLADATEGGPFGLKDGGLEGRGIEVAMLLDDYRSAFARRDTSVVRAEQKSFLRSRGITFNSDSLEHQRVGVAILQGLMQGYEAASERQAGRIIPTPEHRPAAEPQPTQRPSAACGPLLSAAFVLWQRGGGAAGSKKPSGRTVQEADFAVRRFTEMLGDLPLGEITKEGARSFRDALAKLPTRLPKGVASLPLPKILKRDLTDYPPRDAATVNKALQMLGAIVSCAEREGELDKVPGFANPFGRTLKLAINHIDKEGREVFTPSDLKSLLGSGVFTRGDRPAGGGGEAAFWFPLIGLLSGLRLNEIAGLRIADLRHDEGAPGEWFFDINTRSGRSVKTRSSVRLVPAHPALIGVGLLRYRQALLDAGASPMASLWPHVSAAQGRSLAAPWSQWFTRYRQAEGGITDAGKVFHSFRHTFKQMAREARVPEEVHDALTGHASGSVGRGYGRVPLKTLADAMTTIAAPEVISGLRWAEGDRPRSSAARRRPEVNLRSTRGERTQPD